MESTERNLINNLNLDYILIPLICISNILFLFLSIILADYTQYLVVGLFFVLTTFFILNPFKKITVDYNVVLWNLFIMVSILGLVVINLNNFRLINLESIIYIISIVTALLNYIVLLQYDFWEKYIVKGLLFIGIILFLGSIIQLLFPEFIIGFSRIVYGTAKQERIIASLRNNVLIGITYDPSVNGFFLLPLLYHAFIKICTTYSTRSKFINSCAFTAVLVFIILTKKRFVLIASLIILLYLATKYTNLKFSSIIRALLVVGLLFYLITNTEAGQQMLFRTFNNEDVTSGRMEVWQLMLEHFSDRPIFGNGTYTTTEAILLNNGHNIYLQILRENGLLGLIPFASFLLVNLVRTNKILSKVIIPTQKYLLGMSISIQLLFILYGFTGNPLYEPSQLIVYFLGVAIAMNTIKKIT